MMRLRVFALRSQGSIELWDALGLFVIAVFSLSSSDERWVPVTPSIMNGLEYQRRWGVFGMAATVDHVSWQTLMRLVGGQVRDAAFASKQDYAYGGLLTYVA